LRSFTATDLDEFKIEPGFENFQKIEKGQLLYQLNGNDGFFCGRAGRSLKAFMSQIMKPFQPFLPNFVVPSFNNFIKYIS